MTQNQTTYVLTCMYCTRPAEYQVENPDTGYTLMLCYLDKYFYVQQVPHAAVFLLVKRSY